MSRALVIGMERLKQSLGASERFRLEDTLSLSAQLTTAQAQLAVCREALERIDLETNVNANTFPRNVARAALAIIKREK